MPNMSNTSRSMASVPGCTSNSVGTRVDSGTCTRRRMRRGLVMVEQVDDHLEALGLDALGQVVAARDVVR
jgi:hypothetical protein